MRTSGVQIEKTKHTLHIRKKEYFYIIPKLIYSSYIIHINSMKDLGSRSRLFFQNRTVISLFQLPVLSGGNQQNPGLGIFQSLFWEENVGLYPWTIWLLLDSMLHEEWDFCLSVHCYITTTWYSAWHIGNKDSSQLLEATKGKGTDYPLEPPEWMQPHQYLDFNSIRLTG